MRKLFSLIAALVLSFAGYQNSFAQCSIVPVPDMTICHPPVYLSSSTDPNATFSGPGVSFQVGAGSGSQTFNYTGSVQSYTVPAGVTSLDVDAYGAKGGDGSTGAGGWGGRIQTTISVTPGQVLDIYVGGSGGNYNNTGGFNGGANNPGTNYPNNIGGGGGASDIRPSGGGYGSQMVVAGGGGGGGYNGCGEAGGAGGGSIGGSGSGCGGTTPPTGGTQSAGGTGGIYPGWGNGSDGSLGMGGNGGSPTGGAGGGGGWYGGGGGEWQGGGGGSNFTTGSNTTDYQGVQNGDGMITVSYNNPTGYYFDPSVSGAGVQTITVNCIFGTETFNINVSNFADPCANVLMGDCGSAYYTVLADGCSAWSFEGCWQGLGEEELWQYTAASTGNYDLVINSYSSASNDYTEFYYKDASLGCDQNNFTCLGSWNTTGTVASLSLNAGSTYYILLDRTDISLGGTNNVSWVLNCPQPTPCTSIVSLTDADCGNYLYTTLANTGDWNFEDCGDNTPGAEQIYQFTPSMTGSYSFVDDSWGDETIDYSYKDASLGCDINNWTCIATDSWSTSGTFATISLNAGTTYYFLLDREDNWNGGGTITATWNLLCPCGAPDPCSTQQTISSCNTDYSATLDGCGNWTNYDNYYGYYTYGGEQLYTYTPTLGGTYSITVNSIGGQYDYVNYSYKDASLGCDQYNFSEIQDFYGTGNFGSFTLNAGTTYYFLVDKTNVYGSGTTIVDWQLNCPYDPCSSIQNVTDCGVTTYTYASGNGAWNYENCGSYEPGKESIYTYTPSVSGFYSIWDDTQYDDSYAWSYKDASLGCDMNNWNCIGTDYWGATGVIGSTFSLNAGTTYYILLDKQDDWSGGGTGEGWHIGCPAADPCASVTTYGPCGTSQNTTLSTTGAWNYEDCGNYDNGQEAVYAFTPASTGYYALETSNSYNTDYLDFSYKDGGIYGCDVNNWTCIGRLYPYNSGYQSPGSVFLTGGELYYFVIDREDNWNSGSSISFDWDISCALPDPCNSIIAYSGSCGSVQTTTLGTTGSWTNEVGCGYTNPGQEQIYSFVPSVTATYGIDVTNGFNTDYISFGWKDASAGCNNTGWSCLGESYPYNSTGSFGAMNLTAGNTYYILIDRDDSWVNSPVTLQWDIACPPPDPCTSVQSLASCGTSLTTHLSSLGAWTRTSYNGYSTNGGEQIYTYTPATTGTYSIGVSNYTNNIDYINFAVKDATLGCDINNWTNETDSWGTGTFGSFTLNAGTNYYILLDKTNYNGSFSTDITWALNCPPVDPCTVIQTISSCNTSLSTNLPGVGEWVRTSYNGYSTNGGEQIYQFTAPSTGNYVINYTGYGGQYDYVNWAYKDASLGCDINNWTNLTDTWFPAASFQLPMTGGSTYYILMDKTDYWGSGPTTINWDFECAPADPCTTIQTIATCNSNESTTLNGVGMWNRSSYNGYTTNGGEQIYQYTATTTGPYIINYTSYGGQYDYVNWAYKDASLGCDQNNWTNVTDTWFPTATFQLNMTAGTTYYILLDKTDYWGSSQTTVGWNFECPPTDPCTTVATYANCGDVVATPLGGQGLWTNETGCGWTDVGAEQIYQYTATITGNYNLEIQNSYNQDYTSFAYKNSTLGCDANNWSCIGVAYPYTSGSYILGSVSLIAGNTYDILLDREDSWVGSSPITITWDLQCGAPAPPNDDCSGAVPVVLTSGVPVTEFGNDAGAATDCGYYNMPTVWHAVTLTGSCNNLTVSYCGNDPARFGDVWIIINPTCPLTCYGDIFNNGYDHTSCGDGNWTVYFNFLPAGTYYVPILGQQSGYNTPGPYQVTFESDTCPPPPPNDDCSGAVPVALTSGVPVTEFGNNIGATPDCGYYTMPTVWHAVTVTGSCNNLTVSYCGNDPSRFGDVWIILNPSCPISCYGDIFDSNFGKCVCNDGNWSVEWDNLAAGTYFIPILSQEAGYNVEGPYQVTFESVDCPPPPAPPSNDDCSGALPVLLTDGVPVTEFGDNTGATNDCGYYTMPTTWHAVTLTDSCTQLTVKYCGNNSCRFGDVWIIMNPTCPLSCYGDIFASSFTNSACGDGNWTVQFSNLAPGTYNIPILGQQSGYNTPGPYQVTFLAIACPPPCQFVCPAGALQENEVCQSNYPNGSNGGCNSVGTPVTMINPGDTYCGEGWFDGSYRDTDWYEYTTPTATTLTWTVSSQFKAAFFILNGVCPTTVLVAGTTFGNCDTESISLAVLPGTYRFFVGPTFTTQVNCGDNDQYWATLSVPAPPNPPVNDLCVNAIDVTTQFSKYSFNNDLLNCINISGDNTNGTVESGEPNCGGWNSSPNNSIWYRFVSPTCGSFNYKLTTDNSGSTLDANRSTQLALWYSPDGTCNFSQFVNYGCSDNNPSGDCDDASSGSMSATIDPSMGTGTAILTGGATYYFQVDGDAGIQGQIEMTLAFKPDSPSVALGSPPQNQIVATWPNTGANNYDLYIFDLDNGGYAQALNQTTFTKTWSNLQPSTHYAVQEKNACQAAGAENFFTAMSSIETAAATCPDFTAGPTCDIITNTSITTSWQTIPSALKYKIYKRKVGNNGFQVINNVTNTSHTWNSLLSGTQYEFWVQAICYVGGGDINPTSPHTFCTTTGSPKFANQDSKPKDYEYDFNGSHYVNWDPSNLGLNLDGFDIANVEINNGELTVTDLNGNDVAPNQVNGFNIYPNPASNSATIALNLTDAGAVNIKVYDLQGKLVRDIDVNTGVNMVYSLDVTDLASGMYNVTVSTGSDVQTRIGYHEINLRLNNCRKGFLNREESFMSLMVELARRDTKN